MWVDPFLQNDLQKEKVKQASEQKEQVQLGALSLKELNKMQGLDQVGFSVGSNPQGVTLFLQTCLELSLT